MSEIISGKYNGNKVIERDKDIIGVQIRGREGGRER